LIFQFYSFPLSLVVATLENQQLQLSEINEYIRGADFLHLQYHVVTDLGRLIYDRQLKSFCSIQLHFKFEPLDLKSTVTIDYRMKLRHY
jgi:hypothetical protein